MKISNEQVNSIINYLQGSTSSLGNAVDMVTDSGYTENDLTEEQLHTIDNNIFLCNQCGWWCDISESNEIDGEIVCNDCGG